MAQSCENPHYYEPEVQYFYTFKPPAFRLDRCCEGYADRKSIDGAYCLEEIPVHVYPGVIGSNPIAGTGTAEVSGLQR